MRIPATASAALLLGASLALLGTSTPQPAPQADLDPVTGRILRTQLEPQHGAFVAGESEVRSTATAPSRPLKSKTVVTYAPDRRLGIWVPALMQESHATSAATVTGTATYSNCRRFEATARIKNDD